MMEWIGWIVAVVLAVLYWRERSLRRKIEDGAKSITKTLDASEKRVKTGIGKVPKK